MKIFSRYKKGKKTLMNEINVTPFVDVMLVLLIIFMITAPLLTTGIKINLPKSTANQISEKKEPITITINKKGEIYLQNNKMESKKLIKKLSELKKQDKDLKIYIRGDRDINYGKIMKIMGEINQAGFKKVALVSELIGKFFKMIGSVFLAIIVHFFINISFFKLLNKLLTKKKE